MKYTHCFIYLFIHLYWLIIMLQHFKDVTMPHRKVNGKTKASCWSQCAGFSSEWISRDYWFENGAVIGSQSDHVSLFLQLNMKYELSTLMAEMFCKNFLNLTPGLQNLWINLIFWLFSVEMWPICEPTSNGVTVVSYFLMSVLKC